MADPVTETRARLKQVFEAFLQNHQQALNQGRRNIALDPAHEEAARKQLAAMLAAQHREILLVLCQAIDLLLATIQPEAPVLRPRAAEAAAQANSSTNGRSH